MERFLLNEEKVCHIYKDTEKTLDKTIAHIVQLLDRDRRTIATAESCTGGLLSQLITSVAGASSVFELGLCTYAARMKTKLLAVPEELIADRGVVSAEVAAAMAEGLRQLTKADLCLSVTGLAGPGGGTPEQPVGTVYLGMILGEKEIVAHLQLWRYHLHTRAEIRHGVAVCAFGIAECYLMEEAECRKKRKTLL